MTTALAPFEFALPASGVVLTPTSLEISDPNLTYETYEAVLRSAGSLYTASKWWLGDALNWGETIFGEKYAQAIEDSGLSYDRLRNIAWVCRNVARSRRRDNLRFSHHEVVASLEPAEQTKWLDATVENRWTIEELRLRIREVKTKPISRPEWSGDAPASTEPLSAEQVEQAETRAAKTLSRTLPDGHPLWRNEAESNARDVIALAATAKLTLLERRLLTACKTLVETAGELSGEGVVVQDGAFQEVAALVHENGSGLGEEHDE